MSTLDTDATLDAGAADTGPEGLSRAGKVLFNSLEQRMFGQSDVQRLGRYHLIDTLGRGAMGIVYRAYDPDLDRRVAVKVVTLDGDEARARMTREAKVLAKLNHPNVVTVHEVGNDGDDVFVVMEYVDGGTLSDWMVAHPKGESGRNDALIDLALQALEGLAVAHEHGLVHRDIKPANMLLGKDGRLRIADFGLARPSNPNLEATADDPVIDGTHVGLTQAGQVVGTPAFMAPEQFRGGADACSDQFGLAVSFYLAFFDQRPFDVDSAASLAAAISHSRIDAPIGVVPSYVLDVLLRAMRPDPADRFEDARAMARALRNGRRRRNRLFAVAALGAGAAALGGVAWGAAPEPCRSERDKVEAVIARHVPRIEQLLADSERPYADEVGDRFVLTLDAFADRWSERTLEACRDARVEEPERAAFAERRRMCLDDGLESVDQALAAIESLTFEQVDGLPSLIDVFEGFIDCRDPDQQVDDARGRELLSMFRAAHVADVRFEPEKSRELFEAILASTRKGEASDLRAEVYLRLISNAMAVADQKAIDAYTLQAIDEAERSGDPELIAYAWVAAAMNAPEGDSDEAFDLFISLSRAARERGDVSDFTLTRLGYSEASLYLNRGRFDEALEVIEQTRAPALRVHSGTLAILYTTESALVQRRGDLVEARRLAEMGVEVGVERLGPHHPDVAAAYLRLGDVQSWQGDDAASVKTLDKAIEALETRPGLFSRNLFHSLVGRADAYRNMKQFDRALADYGRAVEVARTVEDNEALMASSNVEKARTLTMMGRHIESLTLLDEALAEIPGSSVWVRDLRASGAILRAQVLASLDRDEEARTQLRDAQPWIDEAFGDEGVGRLQAASQLADVWVATEDYALADAEVERFLPKADNEPMFRAMLERARAESLKAQGDVEQARGWAQRALTSMTESGAGEHELAPIRELLETL